MLTYPHFFVNASAPSLQHVDELRKLAAFTTGARRLIGSIELPLNLQHALRLAALHSTKAGRFIASVLLMRQAPLPSSAVVLHSNLPDSLPGERSATEDSSGGGMMAPTADANMGLSISEFHDTNLSSGSNDEERRGSGSGDNTGATSPSGGVGEDRVTIGGVGRGDSGRPDEQAVLRVQSSGGSASTGVPKWMRKQKSRAAEMDRRRPEAMQAVRLAKAEQDLRHAEKAVEESVWLAARQRPYLLFEFVLPNGVLGGVDARAALRPFMGSAVGANESKRRRRARRAQQLSDEMQQRQRAGTDASEAGEPVSQRRMFGQSSRVMPSGTGVESGSESSRGGHTSGGHTSAVDARREDDDYSVQTVESIHDVGAAALAFEHAPWMEEDYRRDRGGHEFDSDDDIGQLRRRTARDGKAAGKHGRQGSYRGSGQRGALMGNTSSTGRVSGVSDVNLPDEPSSSGSNRHNIMSRST